jgi:hypothetical protein
VALGEMRRAGSGGRLREGHGQIQPRGLIMICTQSLVLVFDAIHILG